MTTVLWCFAAWCALATAMPRHHLQCFGHEGALRVRLAWRCAGAAGLSLALAHAAVTDGWALGALQAVAAAGVTGALVPLALAWAPRHTPSLAVAAAVLGAWAAT